MNRLRQMVFILRQYGWIWVIYRLKVAIEHYFGLDRLRMPIRAWASDQIAIEKYSKTPLLFPVSKDAIQGFLYVHPEACQNLLREANEILQGRFRKFEGESQFFGTPPQWNEEFPGKKIPAAGIHWSRIKPFEDIKLVWELSRMGWAQILARAYAFTGDEAYAESFWMLLEHWHKTNPPNQGPQWICGQEVAIRSFALVFADSLLFASPSSTPLRRARLQEIVLAGADRIEPHFHYARSQRNNHALNEALGLMTAALLSPDIQPQNGGWYHLGSSCFAEDLLDQLDAEGSYIQHSTIYHRVMIHACTWRLLLARIEGTPLDGGLLARMEAGLDWMVAMVDPSTGMAPNLGSNDGANILRFSICPYQDHRPSLQGLAALLDLPLPYPPGPWDEPVLWLLGQDPGPLRRRTIQRADMAAPGRGHYLRLFEEGSLYFRCATYQDRPSQSDPLHVDLTWRGLNVLCDAGTYRYNAPPPWRNTLAYTGAHNTVTIDGQSAMGRVGPFLWLDWDVAEIQHPAPSGWLIGERRPTSFSPMKHRRSVFQLGPKHWVILDEAEATQPEPFRIHWLLPDLPYTLLNRGLVLTTPEGPFQLLILGPGELAATVGDSSEMLRGRIYPPAGWRSPCYFQLEPALAVSRESAPARTARWISVAGEGPFDVSFNQTTISLKFCNNLATCELPMSFVLEN